MISEIIPTLKCCIGSIQLKLYDCGMEKISFERILKEKLKPPETPRNVNNNLNLLEDNHFEYVNPFCPSCSSHKVIKQEYRQRNPILAEFGPQVIYQRRYKCKECGRKFTTSLDSVIKPRHRYANICKDKAKFLMESGARSLRKIAEDFYTFYGFLPSHQLIQNWIQTGVKKRITNIQAPYSGYYCYDEQHIKIKGKWNFRLTLYDFILNIPVAEEIAPKKTKKAIYNFLKETTENIPFYALTTDHLPEYKTITDCFRVIHQQCIFHLYKMIGTLVYPLLRNKTIHKQDKIRLILYFTEIKNIFRTFNEKTAIKRLETVLEKFDDIPKVLQRFITKKIIPDFQRLTQFMRYDYISRTSNPDENYYRQTDPEQIKRKYKKPEGFLNYANLKMQYWTKKHGKIPNPH
jgi:transposase-like protein